MSKSQGGRIWIDVLPTHRRQWLNWPGLTSFQAIFTGAGRDFTGAELGKLGGGQKLLVLGGAAATGAIAT